MRVFVVMIVTLNIECLLTAFSFRFVAFSAQNCWLLYELVLAHTKNNDFFLGLASWSDCMPRRTLIKRVDFKTLLDIFSFSTITPERECLNKSLALKGSLARLFEQNTATSVCLLHAERNESLMFNDSIACSTA